MGSKIEQLCMIFGRLAGRLNNGMQDICVLADPLEIEGRPPGSAPIFIQTQVLPMGRQVTNGTWSSTTEY